MTTDLYGGGSYGKGYRRITDDDPQKKKETHFCAHRLKKRAALTKARPLPFKKWEEKEGRKKHNVGKANQHSIVRKSLPAGGIETFWHQRSGAR